MNDSEEIVTNKNPSDFKKPILIGKIGKLPRQVTKAERKEILEPQIVIESVPEEPTEAPPSEPSENASTSVLSYKEPDWSGLPTTPSKIYSLDVLKSGSIIEHIDLMSKSCWVFGRLPSCDVPMAHPTISRYHALLQYRSQSTSEDPQGFYLYDLNSTHGTFLNKCRLKSKIYARVQVGHMIRLGCSTRTYILSGPEEDTEAESELTVTQLKEKRAQELLDREMAEKNAALKAEQEAEERRKKEEERGIDWGMGEDADEETDLAENPFARTNNEDLYIDDPKKALRGFMEREGVDFEYDCKEQGMGHFLCKVVLPIDDEKGRAIVAEALHKGKKKEAVIQCALEACRILDQHGLLRQATHESRKRKVKNWEENDFYDSDDDTYLDRTGIIEKKRNNRIKAKVPQQPETYQSLLEKEKVISEKINSIEKSLHESRTASQSSSNEDVDSLDSYMQQLKHSKLDKQKITQLKTDLTVLKLEHANVLKLVNIARPADLPPLKAAYQQTFNAGAGLKNKLPIFGKRIKLKVQKPIHQSEKSDEISDDEEELKLDKTQKVELSPLVKLEKEFDETISCLPENLKHIILEIWTNLKSIPHEEKNEISTSSKNIAQKLKELQNIVTDNLSLDIQTLIQSCAKLKSENIESRVCTMGKELNKIAQIIVAKTNSEDMKYDKKIEEAKELRGDKEGKKTEDADDDDEKKKRKNQRRIQQRQMKSEIEKRKGYEEDAVRDNYSMWVPPENQSGDGRTSLNEKFGY